MTRQDRVLWTKIKPLAVIGAVLLVAAMVVFSVVRSDNKAVTEGFDPERFARISARMSKAVRDGEMIGGVGLVARNGRIVYQESYGVADKESGRPIREDTLFRIYSMTKPITSVAVLMLYEQGKLSLQDPIAKYLPELGDLKLALSTAGLPQSGSVVGDGTKLAVGEAGEPSLWGQYTTPKRQPRIIDLLSHTAGFTYGIFGTTEVDELYREAKLGEPSASLAEYTQRLGKIPLQYEPGERWHYSVASDVLGRLVEVVSGQRFSDFLRDQILLPLGMENTQFQVADKDWHRLAGLYSPAGTSDDLQAAFGKAQNGTGLEKAPVSYDRGFRADAIFESGGGGLVSTIRDYYRFSQMLLNGGALDGVRLLSPKTIQLMTMNRLTEDGSVWGAMGRGFGLGVAVSLDPAALMRVGTAGEYNWGGAAGTGFWIDPTENMVGIFFTQSIPHTTSLRDDFKQLSYQAIIESYVEN